MSPLELGREEGWMKKTFLLGNWMAYKCTTLGPHLLLTPNPFGVGTHHIAVWKIGFSFLSLYSTLLRDWFAVCPSNRVGGGRRRQDWGEGKVRPSDFWLSDFQRLNFQGKRRLQRDGVLQSKTGNEPTVECQSTLSYLLWKHISEFFILISFKRLQSGGYNRACPNILYRGFYIWLYCLSSGIWKI